MEGGGGKGEIERKNSDRGRETEKEGQREKDVSTQSIAPDYEIPKTKTPETKGRVGVPRGGGSRNGLALSYKTAFRGTS